MAYEAWMNTDIGGLNDNLIDAINDLPISGNVPNSVLTPVLIEADPVGEDNLANLYLAYTVWKNDNPTKIIVQSIPVMGGDGKPGIIINYK